MQFIKQSFMEIELDVAVGHPEHEVLFLATQVATAAGLKAPADSVKSAKKSGVLKGLQLGTLTEEFSVSPPLDSQGRKLRSTSVVATEAETYQMLLRGHAPQSEPFRKWVTEEVLPSIRRTGGYSMATAAVAPPAGVEKFFLELFARLDRNEEKLDQALQEIASLKGANAAAQESLLVRIEGVREELHKETKVVTSPYEETEGGHLLDGHLVTKATYLGVAQVLFIDADNANQLKERVLRGIEKHLRKVWKNEDGRPLKEHVCENTQRWTVWPVKWAKENIDKALIRAEIAKANNEKLRQS